MRRHQGLSMQWSDFKIQTCASDKLYFKKYHYKLEVCTPLATYLRSRLTKLSKENIKDYVRRTKAVNYNYGGSWALYRGINQSVIASTEADIDEIIAIGSIIREVADLKYTIEDTCLRIFSDSEQQLYDIAKEINTQTGKLGYYASIWAPDPAEKHAIDNGYEILTKDPGYTHKVTLRDRLVGRDTKHQIFNYLTSLGDEVKLTPGVKTMFEGNGGYIYSGWFRTNDTSIVTFIELMSPGIIRNIAPVYVKNK